MLREKFNTVTSAQFLKRCRIWALLLQLAEEPFDACRNGQPHRVQLPGAGILQRVPVLPRNGNGHAGDDRQALALNRRSALPFLDDIHHITRKEPVHGQRLSTRHNTRAEHKRTPPCL